ncbi:ubiquitin-like protein nedd8 [Histomonas meleagridis]|uniref:ubiquitin-like protein nedd8 n=1 Tax=Histomonas meleagridis TaxID=135588 RepID=UPI00355A888F|nr:ubiquitin-like protein nedd8 [Histomonas meleagridis]KAH0797968.1 ubiquitin-like protein nedd8 [Histomonas meleagridis]
MFGSPNKIIKIIIRSLRKKGKIELFVPETYSISNIKKAVCEKNNFSIDKIRLLYQGKLLISGRTLLDYSIGDGETIYAVPQPREPPQYLPISFHVNVTSISPQIFNYRPETRDFDRQLGNMRYKIAIIQERFHKVLSFIAQSQKDPPEKLQDNARTIAGIMKHVIEETKEGVTSLKQYHVMDNHGHPGATFTRTVPLLEPPEFTPNGIIEHITDGLSELFGATPGSGLVPRTVFTFPNFPPPNEAVSDNIDLSLMEGTRQFYQTERNAPIPTAPIPNETVQQGVPDALYINNDFTQEEKDIMDKDRMMIEEAIKEGNMPQIAPDYFRTRININD